LNRDVDLTIARDERDTATVLVVSGEVDVHSAARLRDEVHSAELRDLALVIDLQAVPFMDSTGLGVLVGALARSQDSGRRLVLCGVSDRILRLLSLTGLDGRFTLVDDVDAALTP
jgi:anti-sigma B factor antagonist